MYAIELDYDEELSNAVSFVREAMPDDIRRLINTLKYDLYFGPYDEGYQDGDEEYFYPGFVKGADIARDWLDDNVSDVKLTTIEFNEETDEEFECDAGEIDARDICREILGRELFSTLY
jgi:predicted transcriptional regulator